MTNYLLDTDIAVELIRGQRNSIATRLASINRERIFLSSVTVAELLFGALRSRNPEKELAICRKFISPLSILDLDYAAAERSSLIRAELEGLGKRIGPYDVLIAGIALSRDCVVVTHNVREFERVPGLRIEDWFDLP